MRVWKIILYSLGIIPWIFVVTTLISFVHIMILAQFETCAGPETTELPIYTFYMELMSYTLVIWLSSLIIWLVAACTYVIVKRTSIHWRLIKISSIGQLIAFGVLLIMSIP